MKLTGLFTLEPKPLGVKTLPKIVDGNFAVKARSTPTLLGKDHFDADMSITVKPAKHWYDFFCDADATVSGRFGRTNEWKIKHSVNVGLTVRNFKNLVELLASKPYAVPAPFHVFNGPLGIIVHSAGDSRKKMQDFDYTVKSGLSAGRQALKFEAKGRLSATELWSDRRSFSDKTDVLFQDVALQLPRFDLLGMAAVIPDSRITTGPQAANAAKAQPPASASVKFPAEIGIRTAKPIILYSNLSTDPIPVGVTGNISLPQGDMTGNVSVKAFHITLFRRVAYVDHFTLGTHAGSGGMTLDGLITCPAAEAKIYIRILGTTEKPQVQFESDPPMSSSDIIAMLVFGKSPDKMDSDQQATAANVQTAVANKAFGLASLYLLASTPIDYVGYDPVSKTYTVKLRVPGGAVLQLDSDGQSSGVSLRKRVASHLAIQTEISTNKNQGNAVTTLLEWYGRH